MHCLIFMLHVRVGMRGEKKLNGSHSESGPSNMHCII